MNSTWSALFWKEWREQRMLLAVFTFALLAPPLVAVFWSRYAFFGAASGWLFALPFLGLFLAMHLAAGEQSAGTIRFLQSLPTSGRRPAAAKLIVGCLTVVLPVAALIAAAALWGWLRDSEAMRGVLDEDLVAYGSFAGLDNWYASRFLAATCGGVSILLWMAAAGVNRSDEVRAAAVGMLVILGVWGSLAMLGYFVDRPGASESTRLAMSILLAAAPGGLGVAFTEAANPGSNWLLVLSALICHAGLAAWFVLRFGRVTPGRREGAVVDVVATPADRLRLAPPRRSPLTAILWKQFRESAPLAVLGAGSIVALSFIIAWSMGLADNPMAPEELLNMTFVTWLMIGFAVSIVAGVGVFMEDLKPGINGFWRSRPIRVDQWFAVKYLAGLATTAALLAGGVAVAAGCLLAMYDAEALVPTNSRIDILEGLAMGLLVQAGMYTAAVTLMALMRQPVYAVASAVASVVIPLGLLAIIDYFISPERLAMAAMVTITAAIAVAALALAWQAVRRDWGWKR